MGGALNYLMGLIAPTQPEAAPTGFFQTRSTHTPGMVGPQGPGMAGGYDPSVSPLDRVAQSNLPPDVKRQLMAEWANQPKGFIQVPSQYVGQDTTMRHEQLHALNQNAGLVSQHAPQIAQRVDPGIAATEVTGNPLYKNEIATYGQTPTVADEGSAIDLINFGGKSPGLRTYMMQQLKDPEQKKQFMQLTGIAKSGPYVTQLTPREEMQFQAWVRQNKVPFDPGPHADYDMRGYWKAKMAGDPRARQAANGHFPDWWKTPYHAGFSNDSQYAGPNAPHWEGNVLVDQGGNIVKDER